tara:strand:+ start:407 stop:889 length:483 start_codon:yes stop_codon:yes gene_type:complete
MENPIKCFGVTPKNEIASIAKSNFIDFVNDNQHLSITPESELLVASSFIESCPLPSNYILTREDVISRQKYRKWVSDGHRFGLICDDETQLVTGLVCEYDENDWNRRVCCRVLMDLFTVSKTTTDHHLEYHKITGNNLRGDLAWLWILMGLYKPNQNSIK